MLLSSGGSDWIGGSGKAEKVEGGYRITARKVFSSGAPAGDLLMTSAVLESEGEPPMVLHFGIPMNSPQVKVLDTWRTLGMRGTGSHDVMIDGHVVPEAAVAARRKAGEWHPLFQIIATIAFPLIYSVYLGVAESARDIAIGLAKRKQPSHHVVELAGRMETELTAARLALRIDAGGGSPQRAVGRDGQPGDDRPAARGAARDRGRRAGDGACRRRRLLSRGGPGAAVPRHPGGALSPAAIGTAGAICRRDGAGPAGRSDLLTAVAAYFSTSLTPPRCNAARAASRCSGVMWLATIRIAVASTAASSVKPSTGSMSGTKSNGSMK